MSNISKGLSLVNSVQRLLQQVRGKDLGYRAEHKVLLVLESEGHIKSKWMDSSLVTSVFSKEKVIWSSLTVVTRGASQGSLKQRDKENSCHLFPDSQGEKAEFGTRAHLTSQRGKKEITGRQHAETKKTRTPPTSQP